MGTEPENLRFRLEAELITKKTTTAANQAKVK